MGIYIKLFSETKGYCSFVEAESAVVNYIIGYISQVRPHQYNADLPPNESEKRYWPEYKTVARIKDNNQV